MLKLTERQVQERLPELLDSADGQTIEVTRKGRTIARIVPTPVPLPDLRSFHKTLKPKGKSLRAVVIEERRRARY